MIPNAEALRALPATALLSFLGARRWFGAKGESPRAARVREVVPLAFGGAADAGERSTYALAIVEVELADGTSQRYQVPLGARHSALGTRHSADVGEPGPPQAVLTDVEETDATATIVDATEDPEFRRHLGEAFERGAVFAGDDVRLVIEPLSAECRVHPPASGGSPAESRLSAAEQSNTSVIYGDAAILKLFRRLERGEHPDVEIARFLTTRTTFRNTPELLGVIRLEDAGGSAVAGMLSRYVAGASDAWAHALSRVGAYLAAPPTADAPGNPFAGEARALGRVTRELHEALASGADAPDFAPVRATEADVRAWADATRRSVATAYDLLAARGETLDRMSQAPARALLTRRVRVLDRVGEIATDVSDRRLAGARIRHHGDYHLGQVLRTGAGEWMIIDFEGEPARPLVERRAKHSPLRDVAGMLRSFAYAAAAGAMAAGGLGVNAMVESRSARWEREARAAFLDGYFGAGRGSVMLPRGASDAAPLVALFEIEKIFYELAYELNNRPAWAWIPLRGIARLF